MESMFQNFTLEEQKPIFTTASETKATSTETFVRADRSASTKESAFSPLAAPFQGRGGGSDLLHLLEPRVGDTAPTPGEIDLMSYRIGDNDSLFGDNNSQQNFYMGGSRTESVSSGIQWDSGVSSSRGSEMADTFDFLVKSLSSANNYVSMLTREQLTVLRSIRPSLLYEFLQEIAKVRGDKRMRRALSNECAFCKNNGENEECYSSHALKDWRGRVLCPVLRAFRCPRCGATGDWAHTIKYCPDGSDGASDRQGQGMPSRRQRQAPTPLMMGQNMQPMGTQTQPMGNRTPQTPQPPAPPATPTTFQPGKSAAWWNSYGIN